MQLIKVVTGFETTENGISFTFRQLSVDNNCFSPEWSELAIAFETTPAIDSEPATNLSSDGKEPRVKTEQATALDGKPDHKFKAFLKLLANESSNKSEIPAIVILDGDTAKRIPIAFEHVHVLTAAIKPEFFIGLELPKGYRISDHNTHSKIEVTLGAMVIMPKGWKMSSGLESD